MLEQTVSRAPRALADDATTSILQLNDIDHENQASRVAPCSPQLTPNQEMEEHSTRTRRRSAFDTLRLPDPAAKSDMKYKGDGRFAVHLNHDENDVQAPKISPPVMGVPQIGGGMECQEDDLESDSGYYDSSIFMYIF